MYLSTDWEEKQNSHIDLLLVLLILLTDFSVYLKKIANKSKADVEKETAILLAILAVTITSYIFAAKVDGNFVCVIFIGIISFIMGIIDLEIAI